MTKVKFLTLCSLLLLPLITIYVTDSHSIQASTRPQMADLWFEADALANGTGDGFAVTPAGLTLADGVQTAVYHAPIITAPIPFNALVPQWQATLPPDTDIQIRMRTANAAKQWGSWHTMDAHADWTLPDNQTVVGEMIGVPAADITHHYVQFTLHLTGRHNLTPPLLHHLRLTFIDATNGPTTEELVAAQISLNGSQPTQATDDDYPKPFVISRDVWCVDPACDYSLGLEYHPVSHLIVHHTVSDNTILDWAAHVRAIWSYHTFTLGWGDIGYNYLVDMDGYLYEGHLGGDDVVGSHASAANKGTMALSLLGTFETFDPTPPMLDAAAELFAWKADQRNIDVFDASDALPNVPWGLPHMMGHRDVYGGLSTACPGTAAHALLPWLRDEVANRLGIVSPHIYVDELSGDFSKSAANWYVADGQCGHNTHAYYTWSTTDPGQSTNWGEWRPDLAADGRYRIEAYIPYCNTGAPETVGARYQIHHAHGVSTVTANQNDAVGLWLNLGEFELRADGSAAIRLSDLTTTDNGRGVWFDSLRLLPIEVTGATATNQTPADETWLAQRTVDFQWSISNPENVQHTTLQIATDAAFTHLVKTETWATAVTHYSHQFNQDYPTLYWRVQLTTESGQSLSTPTQFGLDTSPPTSAVHAITYNPLTDSYNLYWQGEDAASGIATYNIEVRFNNTPTWMPLLTQTTLQTAVYDPLLPGTYWFRSQATDAAGNTESVHLGQGDINTTQAVSTFNPRASNQTPAADTWQNNLTVTFNWVLTDVTTIHTTTLQVATNPTMIDPLVNQTIANGDTSYVHTFAQAQAPLYWQVSVTFSPPSEAAWHTIASAPTPFGLDNTPPTAAITHIYKIGHIYFPVWAGADDLSGLTNYHVDYRADGETAWVRWLTHTSLTTATFIPPHPQQTYWLRVQAVDAAGNIESPHPNGDLSTTQAIPFPHAIMLPAVYHN